MMSMLDVAAFTVVVFEWHVHTFFAFSLFAVFDGVVVIPQRRMIKKISFITMILVGNPLSALSFQLVAF